MESRPVYSPDLNPIEHLWFHLKRRLGEYENPSSGILKLWERVEREWSKIEGSMCQNLIESMSRRMKAVIQVKRKYIKY